ncbi:MAG: TonB-dependent receptor [Candidatus Aminicenantes bacterium]|nr:TonB-dependent receptor [Candidatus Aminicenantes bacterium]
MKKAFAALVSFAFLASILLTSLSAQQKEDDQDLFNLSLKELMNIVVTPAKMSQSMGTVTQKIDIIDAKEIERSVSGNRNICEVIAKLPGASVSVLSRNDANWGTYGGIGPKYSTYMLQGLPLDAFVDPMSLDLNAIDHIEVQRGPASVFYPNYLSQDFAGNQSPLAGTINLILKQKIEKTKTLFMTQYGSYNTLNGQIFHQNRIGRFNYFCGSAYEMSDYTNYGAEGSWLNMKKDPEYKKKKIYGSLTLFTDKDEKQKFTIFFQETWHVGDSGQIYQGYDHQYSTVNAGYDIAFSERLNLQSHLGLRSYGRTWQESNLGVMDILKTNNGVNQVIIPVDLSLSWRHRKKHLLSVGADYQGATYYTWSDPLLGYRIYGNKSSALQGGVYAQEEWHPHAKILLRGGLRIAFIKNRIALISGNIPDRGSESWSNLLWSLGARYALSSKVAFYANAGSSFATPGLKSSGGTISMSDLGVPGHDGQLPNPNLKPESGVSADAGIDFTISTGFKVGIRGFHTRIRDALVDIVVSRNPSQTQSINTGSSASSGFEIEVSRRINGLLSWFANGTFLQTNIKNDLDPNQNGVEIPFSPKFVANLGVNWQTPFGLVLAPALNYNDGFYDGTSKTWRRFFKPGVVLNLHAAQLLAKGDSFTLECFAQFYNITNNKFEMPWQFKNPGFSGMVGIKVTFQ